MASRSAVTARPSTSLCHHPGHYPAHLPGCVHLRCQRPFGTPFPALALVRDPNSSSGFGLPSRAPCLTESGKKQFLGLGCSVGRQCQGREAHSLRAGARKGQRWPEAHRQADDAGRDADLPPQPGRWLESPLASWKPFSSGDGRTLWAFASAGDTSDASAGGRTGAGGASGGGGAGERGRGVVDPLKVLTMCRQFRMERQTQAGRLVIQPMAVRQVDEVVDLLTDSFEDYFGIFSYRPFLRQQVSVYMAQRVLLFPRGITLVARLLEGDEDQDGQETPKKPQPGADVRVQGTDSSFDSWAPSTPGISAPLIPSSPSPLSPTSSCASETSISAQDMLSQEDETLSWPGDLPAPSPGTASGSWQEADAAGQAPSMSCSPSPPSADAVQPQILPRPQPRRFGLPGGGGLPRGRVVGVTELSLGPPATPSFLTLNPPQGTAYIGNMAVLHVFRRKGVARALLEAAESLARLTEVKDVHLHCRIVDDAPYQLYSSAGYETADVDHRLAPFLTWERRRFLMRKDL